MGVDITYVTDNHLSQVANIVDKKILAIELKYKSQTDTVVIMDVDGEQTLINLEGDPVGYFLYRYTTNTYQDVDPGKRFNLTDHNAINLHLFRGQAFIKSITYIIGDRSTTYTKSRCLYRLDSIFGSSDPIDLYRYSHGKSQSIAKAFSCYKAKKACEERQYSKNLETCRQR